MGVASTLFTTNNQEEKANKIRAWFKTKRKKQSLLIRLDDRRARVGIFKVSVQETLYRYLAISHNFNRMDICKNFRIEK